MSAAVAQVAEVKEAEKTRQAHALKSRWSTWFWWAAIIQGLGATLVTAIIVLPTTTPDVAQVIVTGSVGTWFTVGYILYITVGVLAVGLTALFYHHLEVVMNKPLRGVANYLAGAHLILMNVGVAAVCAILMYGGYVAGATILPTSAGGLELAKAIQLLDSLVGPAEVGLVVVAIGVLCGGLGFVLSYFRK